MSVDYLALAILAMVMGTFTVRLLPFYSMRGFKDHPVLGEVGAIFPAVTMPLLLVYCLRDIDFVAQPHGVPEFAGVAFVVLLHVWKRNVLLSIVGGLAAYWVLAEGMI